jgi:periplasmic copper chaperone A
MIHRVLFISTVSAVAAMALASPAFAHIDPDPSEAQAGSTLSIGFTIEHGCDSSPTIQIDMRLPDGVTNAAPDPFDGWTAKLDGNVVTYSGGSLAADTEGTFSVTMTLPPTPDTTIFFPIVQRCEVGEIRWIGLPIDGSEPAEPAPALLLTGPVATTVAPVATSPTATEAPVTTTSTPVTEVPTATDVSVVATSEPLLIAPASDADSGNSQGVGTWVFIVSMLVVLGLGAFVVMRARSANRNRDADDPHRTN